MSVDVSTIAWDTPPPPKGANTRTGTLTPGQTAVAAKMRPGVWGSLHLPNSQNAGTFAQRLREHGLEAVSRGDRIYFRADA